MKKNILITFCLIALFSTIELFAGEIEIMYNERIPYQVKIDKNTVKGLTATPVNQAFQKAKIPYVWKQVPSKRQLRLIKNNDKEICGVGWFKNSEREKFGKYTLPIYQDKPTMALALASNTKIKSGLSVKEILKNSNLKRLAKDGYSYGKFLDNLIVKIKPKTHKTTGENSNMIKMLNIARTDYFFISQEEADGLIETLGFEKSNYNYVKFSDMPKGNNRYLLCSKKVSDDTITKLNMVLKTSGL